MEIYKTSLTKYRKVYGHSDSAYSTQSKSDNWKDRRYAISQPFYMLFAEMAEKIGAEFITIPWTLMSMFTHTIDRQKLEFVLAIHLTHAETKEDVVWVASNNPVDSFKGDEFPQTSKVKETKKDGKEYVR